jgi:hypothetical protein
LGKRHRSGLVSPADADGQKKREGEKCPESHHDSLWKCRSLDDDHPVVVMMMMMAMAPVVMAMPEMALRRRGIRMRHGKEAECEGQQQCGEQFVHGDGLVVFFGWQEVNPRAVARRPSFQENTGLETRNRNTRIQ